MLTTPSDVQAQVTRQPRPGFKEHLSQTVGVIFMAITLFALSFYVLFTNEAKKVRVDVPLDKGSFQVASLDSTSAPDSKNNDRLVHLSGPLRTAQPLHDPNYKVEVRAAKLKRQVEMYQWVEQQENREFEEDGQIKTVTSYTYNREWKSEVINSKSFDKEIGHINPSAMAVESVTVVAPDVRVGRFALSDGLVAKIKNFKTLRLNFPTLNLPSFLTVDGNYFYHTAHPHLPKVGDVRVSFSYAGLSEEGSKPGRAQKVSVVAMQRGDKLESFKTKSGDNLEILYLGELSAEEVFLKELLMNEKRVWAMRAAGWVLMFLIIYLTTTILSELVGRVPVLREYVILGLKLFALCVSCSLSLFTIVIAWLFYHPMTAITLLTFLIHRIRFWIVPKKNQ